MSIDIHTYLIPPTVRARLIRNGHYEQNLRTVKNLMDYILFTYLCRIYINSVENEWMELKLDDIDPDNSSAGTYSRQLSHGPNTIEIELVERGLVQAIIWIDNNRSRPPNAGLRGSSVPTRLFGIIDLIMLQSLRDFVSSSTPPTTFILNNVVISLEMAKRLITYCEMILGINQPQLEPVSAVPIPEVTPYNSAPYTTPSPVPFELVDDTIPATPGIDGQTLTITLDPNAFANVDPNVTWTRFGIAEEFGVDFVDFIEDQLEDELVQISHGDLMDWLRYFREGIGGNTTREENTAVLTPTITANEENDDLPY